MFDFYFNIFITLFVIINPFAVVPTFLSLTKHDTDEYKKSIAIKSNVIAAIILIIFALLGNVTLNMLGISVPAFQIAGGLLLLYTAMNMVVAKTSGLSSPTSDEELEANKREDISVFPLAIPLIAGPGAMTSIVMVLRKLDGQIIYQAGVFGIIILVLFFNYLLLKYAGYIAKWLGITGTNVITRVFGILVTALAIQLIIQGIRSSILFS